MATRHHQRLGQLRTRIEAVEAQIVAQRELLQRYEERRWTRPESLELLRNLVESRATYRALLTALEAPLRP